MKRRRLLLLLISLLLPISLLLAVGLVPTASAAPPPALRWTSIRASDGTPLAANVFEPNTPGPHPAVVFITSWGLNNAEYLAQAHRFADAGYVVLSYTARGFWNSGGQIEVASPRDVQDVSDSIDWLLHNTDADPQRVGAAGVSYGAGISALAAAHDPRVKAVASLSTWADLVPALLPNNTWSQESIDLLIGAAQVTGRPGPDLRKVTDAYEHDDRAAVQPFGPPRAPSTYVDQINAHGTAVMIANAWSDGIFPPQAILDFYRRLSTPKRIEMMPGDHATPELTGLLGLPNSTWDSTLRWFDCHVRGVRNGVDQEAPVQLEPLFGGPRLSYPDLNSVFARPVPHYLGAPGTSGSITDRPGAGSTGWSHKINVGEPSGASAGPVLIRGMGESAGLPQTAYFPALARSAAGVWEGDPVAQPLPLSGEPQVHLTVTPSSPNMTLVAYLYEVDPHGNARLLRDKPYTILGAQPGAPRTVDFAMDEFVHQIAPGDRVGLVVGTVDPAFRGESREGSTATFTSPAGDPSRLDLPVR